MSRLSRHLICECGEKIYEATGYTLYDKNNNVVACLCETCGEDEKVLEKYGCVLENCDFQGENYASFCL